MEEMLFNSSTVTFVALLADAGPNCDDEGEDLLADEMSGLLPLVMNFYARALSGNACIYDFLSKAKIV